MSRRLIDANELISALYYYEHNEGGLTAYDAQDIINKASTIDIVRCGECIRANHELSGVYCGISDVNMGENGFCSVGERRE